MNKAKIDELLYEALVPQSQQPYALPENWLWVKLGALSDVVSGGTPNSNIIEYYEDGDIPWITPADLSGFEEIYIRKGKRNITKEGYKNSSAKLVPEGSILFSSRAPIGYVAIAANKLCTNQGFKCFKPSKAYIPRYGFWYLKFAKPLAESIANGTTFPEISTSKLTSLPFPLPPLPEQKRIVEKLENLLCKVNEAKALIKEVKESFEKRKTAILTRAFTGELTKNWRENNTNIEIGLETVFRVNKVNKENENIVETNENHKSLKDYLMRVQNDNELYALPDTWTWANLELLMNKKGYCYGVLQPGDDCEDGPRLIRVCDLENGSVRLENLRGISKGVHKQYKRSIVNGGEILISVVGTIGRVAIVPLSCSGFNIARAIAKVPIEDNFNTKYIYYWLTSPLAQSWMVSNAREVARKTLNLEQLKALAIPLPTADEQKEIVRILDRAEILETNIKNFICVEDELDILEKSILSKAFKGRLGTNNPKENALELLKEIIAERLLNEQNHNNLDKIENWEIVDDVQKVIDDTDVEKQTRNLYCILKNVGKNLTPKELWKASGIKDMLSFYKEIKQFVDKGVITITKSPTENVAPGEDDYMLEAVKCE